MEKRATIHLGVDPEIYHAFQVYVRLRKEKVCHVIERLLISYIEETESQNSIKGVTKIRA